MLPCLFLFVAWAILNATAAAAPERMSPLPPGDVLHQLNLDAPDLEGAKRAYAQGNRQGALQKLLDYYRSRQSVIFETELPRAAPSGVIAQADGVLRHVFEVGQGYPPQQYGASVDWDSDPVKDIEWRANMQRFYWQSSLVQAYLATKDENYVKAWMQLTRDWIEKHPVNPLDFTWLDIQVGIRATNLCTAFEVFRHSRALTPEFLAVFLTSINDHAQKSFLHPRLTPHNKAILEVMGLCRIAIMFPEFRESPHWLTRSFEVFSKTLSEQVNSEGVQREWSPNYHTVVAAEMMDILHLCLQNHHQPPPILGDITKKMFSYWVAMTAPDWTLPMFGDTRRDPNDQFGLTSLKFAARLFHEPGFEALADRRRDGLASVGSRFFPEAGMYFLRSGWDKDATYMALHNSPPGLSVHDQPDNGTFELYALGRWLMTDSGSYAYPETPLAGERDWFRRTASHQTLTLVDRNSASAPRFDLWKQDGEQIILTFENASYPQLTHRRTIFFVDRRYFVLIDEAIGSARGALDLHFQFAPGPFEKNARRHFVHTAFPQGANVLVWERPDASVELREETGQTSTTLNEKSPRPAIVYRSLHQAPAVFVTVIAPYLGATPPNVDARFVGLFEPGQDHLEVALQVARQTWRMGRDLSQQQAWCSRAEVKR
jgi:heparan-sulfate lyase